MVKSNRSSHPSGQHARGQNTESGLSVGRWLPLTLSLLATFMILSCGTEEKSTSNTSTPPASTPQTYIYVASGTAYAGNGITPATATNTIVRYTTAGVFDRIVRDYTNSPGDSPIAMVNYSTTTILVLVENTSSRRIEEVAKDGSSYSTFLSNGTALSAQLRSLALSADGGFLVSKGTAIEKFNSAKTRITVGANPFINAPASTCATSTTLSPKIAVHSSGNIVMLHAAASPNNQVNYISKNGYTTTADCLSVVEGASANHYPTAVHLHSGGKLLVGYSSNTGPVHQIYSYDLSSTAITAAAVAYNDTSVLQGISEIAAGPDGSVLVAASAPALNTIEKFTISGATLSRVGTSTFIGPSVFTKSVTAILTTE